VPVAAIVRIRIPQRPRRRSAELSWLNLLLPAFFAAGLDA
jgi:hypothetical protein